MAVQPSSPAGQQPSRAQPSPAPTAQPSPAQPILPIGGRLLPRSSQSLARILRRSQAHIFSTGLRSGEDGGTRHARTPAVVMARLLAAVCKKASLSQSTVHGPSTKPQNQNVVPKKNCQNVSHKTLLAPKPLTISINPINPKPSRKR